MYFFIILSHWHKLQTFFLARTLFFWHETLFFEHVRNPFFFLKFKIPYYNQIAINIIIFCKVMQCLFLFTFVFIIINKVMKEACPSPQNVNS